MSRADAQFRLRIPHQLRDRVAEQAKRNFRTMNSEITVILANALGDEGQPTTGQSCQAHPAVGHFDPACQGGTSTHG